MAQQEWFIVRGGGKEQGPLTAKQLKDMAMTGTLLTTDQLRRSDTTKPVPANKIRGLFPTPSGPAPVAQLAPVEVSLLPKPPSASLALWRRLNLPAKIGLSVGGVFAMLMFCACGLSMFIPHPPSPGRKADADTNDEATLPKRPDVAAEAGDTQIAVADTPITVLSDSVIEGMELSPDGRFLAANGWAVWNVRTGKELKHDGSFRSGRFSPDGKSFAVLKGQNSLVVLDVHEDKLMPSMEIQLGQQQFYLPTWSPNGKAIAAHCRPNAPPDDHQGGIVWLSDPTNVIYFANRSPSNRNSIDVEYPFLRFLPNSERLKVRYNEPSECTYDAKSGALLDRKALTADEARPTLKKGEWDLRMVSNDDGRVEAWQVAGERLVAVVGRPDGLLRPHKSITPDGSLMATAQHEKKGVEIWDLRKAKKISMATYKRDLEIASANYVDCMKVKAPPISDDLFQRLRIGMPRYDVWKFFGGRAIEDRSTMTQEGRLSTDWMVTELEFYMSKDHPGSRIVLLFRGKGTALSLVQMNMVEKTP